MEPVVHIHVIKCLKTKEKKEGGKPAPAASFVDRTTGSCTVTGACQWALGSVESTVWNPGATPMTATS